MIQSHKESIANEVKLLCKKQSQSKIATKANVSTATISQIVNENWNLIADEMWRKIKINLRIELEWQVAEIQNLKTINELLVSAQKESMSIAIADKAGLGKSQTYTLYERTYENVIYIECKNSWTKKSFVRHLLVRCGLATEGTVEEIIERFVNYVKGLNKAIIIIDQFDKLKDPQQDLFMDFYNDLDGHAAFVLSGVPAFKKRIKAGVLRDKIGYRELYSRIGSKFIELDPISEKDVAAICIANGIDDESFINTTFNGCDGDLRRVKRDIQKYFLTAKKAS